MRQPGANESSSAARQFSLAHLMLLVLALCLLFGMVKLVFPEGTAALIALLFLGVGFAFAIVVLAIAKSGRLAQVLVIIAMIGWMLALLLPAVQSVGRRRPSSCRSNLRQIAAAMAMYEGRHCCLPPPFIADASGKPMHSWRVLILPQLGQQELYDQYRFDEPWDGPNNRKLHDRIVDVYRCPDDHPSRFGAAARQTSYVVVTGPGTAFPGGRQKISIADIANRDGTSNTLLVVELHSSGIHWMEPRDLHVTQMARTINPAKGQGISSKHRGGANVVMADGAVCSIVDTTSPEVVERLITIDDGQPLPKEW